MRGRRATALFLLIPGLLLPTGCGDIHSKPPSESPLLADLVDYRTGLAMLREGRVDEAIGVLNRARVSHPRDPNVPNALGLALLYKKDFENALKAFSTALKLEPTFVESRNNRGVCYMEMGRLDEAEADFEAVLDGNVAAEKVNAHLNLGILHGKRSRWVDAERELSLAVADAPQNSRALRERGLVRVRLDDFKGALEDFLSVLKEDRKDPVANYQAALCLLTADRRDLALRYMERTVAAAPESDEGRKAKRFLDSEPFPSPERPR